MKKIEINERNYTVSAEIHLDRFIGYNLYGGGVVIVGKVEEGSSHHLYFYEESHVAIVSGRGHYFVFKNTLNGKYAVFSCWKKEHKIPYGKRPIKIKRRSFKVGKDTYFDRNLNKLSYLGKIPFCKKSDLSKFSKTNYVIFEDAGKYGVYSNIENKELASDCVKITNEKHYFTLFKENSTQNPYETYIDGSGNQLFILGEKAEVRYGELPEIVVEEEAPAGFVISETFHLDKFIGYNLKGGGVVIVCKPDQGTYESFFKYEIEAVQIVSGRGYYFVLEDLKNRGVYGVYSCWNGAYKIPLEIKFPILIKRRAFQVSEKKFIDRDNQELRHLGLVVRCDKEDIRFYSNADFAIFKDNNNTFGIYSYKDEKILVEGKKKITSEEHYFSLVDDDENRPYESYITADGKKIYSLGEVAQRTFVENF